MALATLLVSVYLPPGHIFYWLCHLETVCFVCWMFFIMPLMGLFVFFFLRHSYVLTIAATRTHTHTYKRWAITLFFFRHTREILVRTFSAFVSYLIATASIAPYYKIYMSHPYNEICALRSVQSPKSFSIISVCVCVFRAAINWSSDRKYPNPLSKINSGTKVYMLREFFTEKISRCRIKTLTLCVLSVPAKHYGTNSVVQWNR